MNFKIGDEVIFISQEQHDKYPEWKPCVGTKGTVIETYPMGILFIQWEKGSTSDDDRWFCCEQFVDEVEKIERK